MSCWRGDEPAPGTANGCRSTVGREGVGVEGISIRALARLPTEGSEREPINGADQPIAKQ